MEEMPTDPGTPDQIPAEGITVPEASETPDPALVDWVEKGLTVDDLETR
jgi:hypothetical protein